MKAFLYDGKGLGSEHCTITGEYKTLETMYRYAISKFLKKNNLCHAEIFYNWDNRYGTPNKIIEYANHPMKCNQCSWSRVNGVFIHEKGCPNDHKHWNWDEGEWEEYPEEELEFDE